MKYIDEKLLWVLFVLALASICDWAFLDEIWWVPAKPTSARAFVITLLHMLALVAAPFWQMRPWRPDPQPSGRG